MITQKRTIQAKIEKNGWKIVKIDEYEWWENKVWEINSTWSPIGAKAFITYVVDPQIIVDKNAVWAVLASLMRPPHWQGESTDFTLVFNNKWNDNLPELIEFLSKIRNQ